MRDWCIRIARDVFFWSVGRSGVVGVAFQQLNYESGVLMQYCISTTIFTMILKFCQIEVLGGTRSTNEKKIGIFFSNFFSSNC